MYFMENAILVSTSTILHHGHNTMASIAVEVPIRTKVNLTTIQ
jgi:hypothetical protein